MSSGKSGQPLSLIQSHHRIPAFGERQRHLPGAASNLQNATVGWDCRKGNNVLDNVFWVARPHLVIELGRVIELAR
jgi:hypothetical protein